MSYAGKVVLITGGSKGIGKGGVKTFVAEGSNVVFCARNRDEGKSLAFELSEQGPGKATFIPCDVMNTDEIRQLLDQTISQHGRLDCLINNAGWHPPHKSIDEFSVQDFRDLLDLNLVSIFAACKFSLPHLRKTQGNR